MVTIELNGAKFWKDKCIAGFDCTLTATLLLVVKFKYVSLCPPLSLQRGIRSNFLKALSVFRTSPYIH